MSDQSLELQQAALVRLKAELESFKGILLDQMERYRRTVDLLKESGLSREIYNQYLNTYYERDRSYVNSLINHIDETDVPYVEKNLQQAGGSIEVAHMGFDF